MNFVDFLDISCCPGLARLQSQCRRLPLWPTRKMGLAGLLPNQMACKPRSILSKIIGPCGLQNGEYPAQCEHAHTRAFIYTHANNTQMATKTHTHTPGTRVTHKQASKQARTYVSKQVSKYARKQASKHAHTHARTHARTHTSKHARKQARTQLRNFGIITQSHNACLHSFMHTNTHASMHACMHACMFTNNR